MDPGLISQADRYKLLIGAVVPRPIAWVSTISPAGRLNLAPFSFFTGVGSEPMALLFCPANKADGQPKDTLRNAALPAEAGGTPAPPVTGGVGLRPASSPSGTGEFVVNVVPHELAARMSATSESLPYGESEFELAGLTPTPSHVVKPPRVAGSPLAFECRTMQVIRLAPGVPDGGNIVIGRVVHIYAAEGVVNEKHYVDPALLDAIGRMGGASYCTTRDRFDVARGRAALAGGGMGNSPGGR